MDKTKLWRPVLSLCMGRVVWWVCCMGDNNKNPLSERAELKPTDASWQLILSKKTSEDKWVAGISLRVKRLSGEKKASGIWRQRPLQDLSESLNIVAVRQTVLEICSIFVFWHLPTLTLMGHPRSKDIVPCYPVWPSKQYCLYASCCSDAPFLRYSRLKIWGSSYPFWPLGVIVGRR